jgi:hypothetical protein
MSNRQTVPTVIAGSELARFGYYAGSVDQYLSDAINGHEPSHPIGPVEKITYNPENGTFEFTFRPLVESDDPCIHPGVFATDREFEFCPTCQQAVPRHLL